MLVYEFIVFYQSKFTLTTWLGLPLVAIITVSSFDVFEIFLVIWLDLVSLNLLTVTGFNLTISEFLHFQSYLLKRQSHNSQTHSNNSSTVFQRTVGMCLASCGVGAYRVKEFVLCT